MTGFTPKRYLALHKPIGYVSTASDPQGRPTVLHLVESELRLYPVGRLDAESEGLLLLTNDGQFTHRLLHPSFGVAREYRALVRPALSQVALERLRGGLSWKMARLRRRWSNGCAPRAKASGWGLSCGKAENGR